MHEDYVTNPNAKGQFIVLTSLSLRADTSLTLATCFGRMCEQLNDRHIDTSQAVPTACMPPPFPKHRMCTSLSDLTATAEQSVWTGQSLKMCWEKGNVTLVWRKAATGLRTSDFFFSAFLSNKVAPALNAAIKTADHEKRMHLNVSYQHKLSSPNCKNDTHVAVFTAVCGVENDNLRRIWERMSTLSISVAPFVIKKKR